MAVEVAVYLLAAARLREERVRPAGLARHWGSCGPVCIVAAAEWEDSFTEGIFLLQFILKPCNPLSPVAVVTQVSLRLYSCCHGFSVV